MEIQVNKKQEYSTKTDLEQLPKEQLIVKILQLQAHVKQLKNLLNKSLNQQKNQIENVTKKKHFNFSNCNKRHVLLKFLYLGWDYQGYVSQEDTQITIEHHLFNALQKTCLIENRENSNYNRCGRTDKEVSAFCQVISIDLRSKFTENEQMLSENIRQEIDYCGILNKVLPDNIKCISWKPLRNKLYSARFDCIQRMYKYFFPGGNLNIEAMKKGCFHLIGTHDFRNLCKMDVANGVKTFVRNISQADVKICRFQNGEHDDGYKMYYLEIISQAFLWHQIRCIMAILILIGKEYEDPTIIKELLDIEKNPCKPQYNMVAGQPLNLYACDFRNDDNNDESIKDKIDISSDYNNSTEIDNWIYNEMNLCKLIEDLQAKWSIYNVRSTMIREMITDVEEIFTRQFPHAIKPQKQINVFLPDKHKQYTKLLNRKRCESLENRLDYYIKKQRLIVTPANSTTEKE